MLARALVALSELLNITEPHRKRYAAQSRAGGGPDSASRALDLAFEGVKRGEGGKPNGARKTTKRLARR